MKVRTRIYLLQLVVTALMLLLAAVAYLSIQSTRQYLQRLQYANQRVGAIISVKLHANRYSEQIAELLLIGDAERPDYTSASGELEAAFTELERMTRAESGFLAAAGRRDDPRDELHRVQRMRTLHAEIERAVTRLMQLRAQGRLDESVQLFRQQIENRLDAEFEHLLTAAELDEREEVDQAGAQAEALWRRLLWIIAGATTATLAICLALVHQLSRSLVRPVTELIGGAEAISHGRLDHRIAYDGSDELGVLARRFNEMGAQLESQRALVLRAQSGLERQVADRTSELATANKRLRALDQVRVQFLADISHELRTPLTALRGEAEVTLRCAPGNDAACRDALERIVGLCSDMGRLVNDLLFLARSETDTLGFTPARASLQALLTQVAREGNALGRGKSIEVRFHGADPALCILADVQRLKQAFMIVLDNAIKYSPPGEAVDIRVERMGQFAEVVVRDQGRGIGSEELPRVFDRFYRGLAPGSPGSGLGLTIARWLVEKHDGQIALASEAGMFTEAHIRLPLVEPAP